MDITILEQSLSLGGSYDLRLAHLSYPGQVQKLISDIKSLNPKKRKVSINDVQIFISEHCLDEEVAKSISVALIAADDAVAVELWESFGYDLKYLILIPEEGVLDVDIVKKLDIEGGVIRNAYLFKNSIVPPEKTPYAYTYGSSDVKEAAELVAILEQIRKIKFEGQMILDEFFEEIDLRIFYLFAMNEAEAYAKDDPNGGAYLQLAMDANDKIPEELALLSWLQLYVPDKFSELRLTLLDHIWQENRSLFWKGWIRQNKPQLNEDYYDKHLFKISSGVVGPDVDDGAILDELLKQNENLS